MERIELTQNQLRRLASFRDQIQPMRKEIAALEKGVNAMLSTILEAHGAADGVEYELTPDETALVCKVAPAPAAPAATGEAA